MKVEIEIDEKMVIEVAVSKLHDSLFCFAKRELEEALKLELTKEVRAVAREHISELLKTFTFPDGKPFKQYVSDILTRGVLGMSRFQRPRIDELVHSILDNHARTIYEELVKPHAESFRAELKKKVISKLMDG